MTIIWNLRRFFFFCSAIVYFEDSFLAILAFGQMREALGVHRHSFFFFFSIFCPVPALNLAHDHYIILSLGNTHIRSKHWFGYRRFGWNK